MMEVAIRGSERVAALIFQTHTEEAIQIIWSRSGAPHRNHISTSLASPLSMPTSSMANQVTWLPRGPMLDLNSQGLTHQEVLIRASYPLG